MKTKLTIIATFSVIFIYCYALLKIEPVEKGKIKPIDTVEVVSKYLICVSDSEIVAMNCCFVDGNSRHKEEFTRLAEKLDSLCYEAESHLTAKDYEIVIEKLMDSRN